LAAHHIRAGGFAILRRKQIEKDKEARFPGPHLKCDIRLGSQSPPRCSDLRRGFRRLGTIRFLARAGITGFRCGISSIGFSRLGTRSRFLALSLSHACPFLGLLTLALLALLPLTLRNLSGTRGQTLLALGQAGTCAARSFHPPRKTLNLAGGVYDPLLAGIKRVTNGAEIGSELRLRRARRKYIATRASDC
jgi:hypothetical protein